MAVRTMKICGKASRAGGRFRERWPLNLGNGRHPIVEPWSFEGVASTTHGGKKECLQVLRNTAGPAIHRREFRSLAFEFLQEAA